MSKPKRTAKKHAPDLGYIAEELRQFAVPIDSLELDPENARAHGDENRATVAASLRERGQTLPITVRLANRRIMTGNCTVEEMRALGHTHVAALFFDYTEEQAIAWAIVHNRSAELAVWNYEQLAATIGEHPDIDWDATGFDADELEGILASASEQPDTTTVSEHEREIDGEADEVEDEIPEPPAEPITQVGDVVELGPHVLHCCDCMDLLRSLPDNSIDTIVTDPPYGLSPDGRARTWDDIEALRRDGKGPKAGFMGNAWDAGVPGITWARECLRVLKPGGHLIAHSATRTIHRLACAVEDAGFELRDQIGWLHWQGFPKSHNVSLAIDEMLGATRMAPATDDAKRWAGWGTALKPAIEPAVLARKPLSEATVAANVLRWGTGALNIDACRYALGDPAWPGPTHDWGERHNKAASGTGSGGGSEIYGYKNPIDGATHELGRFPANIYACPKPATSEREAGVDEDAAGHPTVKPVKLYRWLLRLVTPPGGTVLEPFGGSGTTLVAATGLDCKVIASERDPKYCDIIRARVTHAISGQ